MDRFMDPGRTMDRIRVFKCYLLLWERGSGKFMGN
jgi:hypothetical protein